MNLIVNVDKNWGIGCANQLLFPIPEDMKFFRETTTGKVVVMGRKTLESFPGGRPLKNRVNIVLTTKEDFYVEGAVVCRGMEKLPEALAAYKDEEVFVIGGGSVYRQLLDYCSAAYITRVEAEAEADSFFPNLDELDNWELEERSEEREGGGFRFRFCRYRNRQPKNL